MLAIYIVIGAVLVMALVMGIIIVGRQLRSDIDAHQQTATQPDETQSQAQAHLHLRHDQQTRDAHRRIKETSG